MPKMKRLTDPSPSSLSVQHEGGFKQDFDWVNKAHNSVVQTTKKGLKPNNIWGSVLEEENMSSFISQMNRNEEIKYSRGAESYDYTRRFVQFSDVLNS